MTTSRKYLIVIGIIVPAIILACFSFYRLTETPPTWMDEGIIAQVARNMAESGLHAITVGPNEFVSAGFVSTGYPTTFPISLAFRIFGTELLVARSVMVLFIIGLFILAGCLIYRKGGYGSAIASLFLFVTFAPIYGHGKNVLGEIPGLFYLLAFALTLYLIEKNSYNKSWSYILAGLFLGLTVSDKPLFILILPAALLALLVSKYFRNWKSFGRIALGAIIPIGIWFLVQFNGESISQMLAIYTNPHSTELGSSIVGNISRFFTESQPAYALIMFVLWAVRLILLKRRKENISATEISLFSFSILIFLAYLRTIGYYRYFFLAEFLALIYLPLSLLTIIKKPIIVWSIVTILVLVQFHQSLFNSWISVYAQSTRSADIKSLALKVGANKVYVYQCPECTIFLPKDSHYQYMGVTKTILIGKPKELIADLKLNLILTKEEFVGEFNALGYKLKDKADRYVLLEKSDKI